MGTFIIKIIDIVAIIALLITYNCVIHRREKAEAADKAAYESQLAAMTTVATTHDTINTENNTENATTQTTVVEIQQYTDGTYEGVGSGYGGDVIVSVTLEKDIIIAIDIIEAKGEDSAYFDAAVGLIDDIITTNSTDVDTVSGATFSSRGILDAVNDALSQAEVTP